MQTEKWRGRKKSSSDVFFLRPLCCTLNVQIIEDFCEKNKDKFRVSASLLILFTPSLIGPVIQQHPAVDTHYISAMLSLQNWIQKSLCVDLETFLNLITNGP